MSVYLKACTVTKIGQAGVLLTFTQFFKFLFVLVQIFKISGTFKNKSFNVFAVLRRSV